VVVPRVARYQTRRLLRESSSPRRLSQLPFKLPLDKFDLTFAATKERHTIDNRCHGLLNAPIVGFTRTAHVVSHRHARRRTQTHTDAHRSAPMSADIGRHIVFHLVRCRRAANVTRASDLGIVKISCMPPALLARL
jgi:hypothetical protein